MKELNELFEDKKEVISEREAFLLRELQTMLDNEELIGPSKDTLVIPARHAWPEYKEFNAYVCQANRSFKNVTHLAFYHGNKIHELVPKILDSEESVEMRIGLHSGELGKLVDYLLETKLREEGKTYKVLFLSPPDSPETVHLDPNEQERLFNEVPVGAQMELVVNNTDVPESQTHVDIAKLAPDQRYNTGVIVWTKSHDK